ncbi:MAG: type II toxin-antitoxin system RatA family toxin [Gammaproteobacteria bacterium]
MTNINRSALVPYTTHEMFTLVDDVESYPDFLPWCKSSTVWSRDDDEVKASVELSKGRLNKTFTTRNRLQKDKIIEMRLVEGPFNVLEGFWRFDSMGELGSKVTLDLEYDFSSKILKLTVGPVFNQIANTLVDAFCERAVVIYGKR